MAAKRDLDTYNGAVSDESGLILKRSRNSYDNINIGGNASVQLGDQHHHYEADPKRQELKDKLDSLSFQEMYTRFDSIVDAEEGTCDWILGPGVVLEDFSKNDRRGRSLAQFSQWYFHGTRLFWVSGKPGSGKSTLLKKLLQLITSKGEIGNIHPQARRGDWICLVQGSTMPIVLRPSQNGLRVVGDAYIYGWVEGYSRHTAAIKQLQAGQGNIIEIS